VKRASGERITKREVRRLESEGFVEGAMVQLHDQTESGALAFSSVSEFNSTAGAAAELKAESKEVARALSSTKGHQLFELSRFSVPGVSGSVAFAFVTTKAAEKIGVKSAVGKGLYIEGSCLLTFGILRPSSRDVKGPLVHFLQSAHQRTEGTCPPPPTSQ
jgi:hypothetical protein